MTEFISRNHGHSCYEIIIKTTNHEHYKATEDFARRLIDHAKPVPDNNVSCKWIPVTERLPELPDENYCSITVLAATTGANSSFPAIYRRGIVRGKRVERLKYCWDRVYDGPAITHWMPLPEPPKEDSDG